MLLGTETDVDPFCLPDVMNEKVRGAHPGGVEIAQQRVAAIGLEFKRLSVGEGDANLLACLRVLTVQRDAHDAVVEVAASVRVEFVRIVAADDPDFIVEHAPRARRARLVGEGPVFHAAFD
ncbi:hypothetical protein SDC9_44216 [bioreactor metagenome]|uniref:Uncharacterized protein n=1 Tax=bioreactor metagenome TaxID=1076179 RepID=A0A644W370_9ZZZZ